MNSWIENAQFYHIYPLGFCGAPYKNDGETVCRLNKLIEWIPHLKELNINALYLGPIFDSSYHGYDTKDYFKIDCRLGTNESFKQVCDKLHENGIKIVLDGVFNHVGREFWAFKDVLQNGQYSEYCSWFKNLSFSHTSPKGDPFSYEGWNGFYDLVKLNLQNEEVVNHLFDAISIWIDEFNIDGIRLDAADCLDFDFFPKLRQLCDSKKKDFWLMGEIIHGDYNRWANPEMLDSVTNYQTYKGIWSSHNNKNYFEVAHALNRQAGSDGMYKNIYMYNFLDNHDVDRIIDILKDKSHINNVYTVLYTMPGMPSIYYGSEFGVHGIRSNRSDHELRPCLELNDISERNDNIFEHLKKLSEIRKNCDALKNGSFENIVIKNEQLVYKRQNNNETVYIALNLSHDEADVDFHIDVNEPLFDVLNNNQRFDIWNNHLHLFIAPCSARILTQLVQNNLDDTQQQNEPETEIPTEPQELHLGRYRHFKGGEYEIIGFAMHSETGENMVIYRDVNSGALWVRPYFMFAGTVTRDGKTFYRFEPII
ncbi:MAG: DUF1653 domain-containing protein [Bacillota bacterium]|nr:DUF1653 domain-containing protein [Bacillota bacterium]